MTSRRKTYTRRALIGAGSLLGCGALFAGAAGGAHFYTTRPESNVGELDFATPLHIPPLLEGKAEGDGRRLFDLTLQTGQTRIVPAGQAETWGVNGPFLAPTLRARRGDHVAFRVHNELPEETSIHWHGMHLPAEMDGGPHQMIAVGETWEPEWTIDQSASTLWYHPHPHGQTGKHVYRGVSGLFLIEDDDAAAASLPHEYGVDDIPLIIQDKRFTDDGDMTMDAGGFLEVFSGSQGFGVIGDTILVNGTWDPFLEVSRERIRFRLLNGSNARFLNVGFADDRPFHLVATENGRIHGAPVELTRLPLGPGERAEIVVSFAPGEGAILRSDPVDLGTSERQVGGNDTWDLLAIRAAPALDQSPALPVDLGNANAAPDVPADAHRREFAFSGHRTINGREMDLARDDEVVPAGALELWHVSSRSEPHVFHVHGATFHVLDVEGEEPEPWRQGPKDSVVVVPGRSVTLAVQFREHVDPDHPYMFHCHILRHEDNGMMGQFVVVEPGTEADVDRTLDGVDSGSHEH